MNPSLILLQYTPHLANKSQMKRLAIEAVDRKSWWISSCSRHLQKERARDETTKVGFKFVFLFKCWKVRWSQDKSKISFFSRQCFVCPCKKCYCFELNHEGPLLFTLTNQNSYRTKRSIFKVGTCLYKYYFFNASKDIIYVLFMLVCLCLFSSMTCEMVSTLFNPLIKQLWWWFNLSIKSFIKWIFVEKWTRW